MAKIFRFSGYLVENSNIEDLENVKYRLGLIKSEYDDVIQQLHIEESEKFEAKEEDILKVFVIVLTTLTDLFHRQVKNIDILSGAK